MNLSDLQWSATVVEEVGFCARRFGSDYAIFGSTEDECRERMVDLLGKSWRWLRLTGWSVGTFTVPRTIWTAT